MQIRSRLTLQFILLVALIILFCFTLIYFMLRQNRRNEFYTRLEQRAYTTGDLFFKIQKLDSASIRQIDAVQRDPLSKGNLTMFDMNGKVLYTNNDSLQYEISNELFEQIKQNEYVRFDQGEQGVLGLVIKPGKDPVVIIVGDIDFASQTKNSYLLNLLIVLYFISIVIVTISGWIFSQRALKPLTKVITQVNNLPIESLESRLTLSNEKDEIGQLAQTFNKLLDRIQNTFNLQKMFLSAASHEMKNPLTAITSQLQVLQLRARSTQEYQETIDSVLDDLSQLNKTTNDLIEFARLSYEINLGVSFSTIRIDDVLWSCKEYYSKVNPASQVKLRMVNLPQDHDHLSISGNEALLKIAMLNLIDNGCKFSEDKSVNVQLTVTPTSLEIEFKDNGIGMSIDQQEHIFEPFYRTNNTSNIGGHGLGLAIVKRIIEFHKAKIFIQSAPKKGSTFKLTFLKKF